MTWLDKLISTLKYFFGISDVEYGTIIVTPPAKPGAVQEIFVSTNSPVNKVWMSLHQDGTPTCGGGQCFVSEATPVASGFSFSVIVGTNNCHVQWVAVIGDPNT